VKADFFSTPTPRYQGVSLAADPLAQALRIGRARVDLSQVEVALRANVSRFRLHQAERGLLKLGNDEIHRLAEVLQLPALTTFAEAGR
jgi:hypothetical protein